MQGDEVQDVRPLHDTSGLVRSGQAVHAAHNHPFAAHMSDMEDDVRIHFDFSESQNQG